MYFAVNPTTSNARAAIMQEATARRDHSPDRYFYALIDTAFDEPLGQRLQRQSGSRWRSIYHGTSLAELCDVSPCLLDITAAQEPLRPFDHLLDRCSGKPMLSFLSSQLDIDDLAVHLRPLIEVITEDELRWPLRFADTRITPALVDTLDPHQRRALLEPIGGWYIIGRTGELTSLDTSTTATGAMSKVEQPLSISDEQFARLLSASEPDTIIETMTIVAPETLTDKTPGDVFSIVRHHCLIADRHGIHANDDRTRLALLGLSLPPGATESEPMLTILGRVSRGEHFSALLDELPDAFWTNDHA